MISTEFLKRDFGIENPPPDELMQSAFRFMMAFFYCEERLFGRKCGFWRSDRYARQIHARMAKDSVDIDPYYSYFKNRYITGDSADSRILALVPTDARDHDDAINKLNDIFSVNDDSYDRKLEAVICVTIRLRNNLFHANKYNAINNDPAGQEELLRLAADFYAEILVRTKLK